VTEVATIEIRDTAGKSSGSRDLAPELFEANINVPLMHQVVVAGLAAIRSGTHSTKTRGDVAGGGKKPWRQKGTGRARQGSIRAPQWTGGGVVHGPHPRSHELRVSKKMRKGAMRSALSDALASGKLAVVDDLAFDEPKTKRAVEIMSALELAGQVLVVLPEPTTTGAVELSFRNLPNARVRYAGGLGVYDVLYADRILFTTSALDAIEHKPAEAPEVAK
jgi:large subunit ribosomal protein L4